MRDASHYIQDSDVFVSHFTIQLNEGVGNVGVELILSKETLYVLALGESESAL